MGHIINPNEVNNHCLYLYDMIYKIGKSTSELRMNLLNKLTKKVELTRNY